MLNWQHFQTHNLAPEDAFEAMSNQLFDSWCRREFNDNLIAVNVVNGSGGDGGVEAYARLKDRTIIGMQAKWFPSPMGDSQFRQIKKSITTALEIRPTMSIYIVCFPKNLTSARMGKSNKPVKNTEMSRWDELESTFTNIKLIRWDANQLLTELQNSDNANIYRHWFENSEISLDLIDYSYNTQKDGWLKTKYNSSLHMHGIIHDTICKLVGIHEFNENILKRLSIFQKAVCKFKQQCDDFFIIYESNELCEQIRPAYVESIKLIDHLEQLKEAINLNIHVELNSAIFQYTEIHKLKSILKEHEYNRNYHVSDLKRSIDSVLNSNTSAIFDELKFQMSSKIVILGKPGTGKTHGVADCAGFLIDNNLHIPILIQAKQITQQDSWKDMLIKALRLSNNWDETELFRAIEALSFRKEISNKRSSIQIIPKILIIIDGIDESRPSEKWLERITEIDAITSKYKRIKFCLTSRPHIFKNYNQTYLYLSDDGDTPVHELFSKYMNSFNITIPESNNWVKWSLHTPLALRIFCEHYANQTVSQSKPYTTISTLLKAKIEHMEEEFSTMRSFSNSDFIIYESLIVIYKQFMTKDEISKDELLTLFPEKMKYKSHNDILDFLCDYGLLSDFTYNGNSFSDIPKIYYSLGIQTFFDYILALLLYDDTNSDPEALVIPESMYYREDSLKLLSLIYLEERGKLITSNRANLINFALINASPSVVTNYVDLVKSAICKNSDYMRYIVNNIVLPVCRIENHPLGALFLHDILLKFETMASRDLFWSVPAYLYEGQDSEIWKCRHELNLSNYPLLEEDNHNGLPLVYAWALTSVIKADRISYRLELMKWALTRPMEYYKLFTLVITTNDFQMKEELFSIAMGLILTTKDKRCIQVFGQFVYEEVFEKIDENLNAAVRYYSRAIAEKAFDNGYLENIDLCRPPYESTRTLDVNKDAALGDSRMGGFIPLDYNLSRYVLCDYITNMFFVHERESANENDDMCHYFSEKDLIVALRSKKHLSLKKQLMEMLKYHRELRHSYKNNQKRIDALYTISNNELKASVMPAEELLAIQKKLPSFDREPARYNNKVYELLGFYSKQLEIDDLQPDKFILAAAYGGLLKAGWSKKVFYGQPKHDDPDETVGVDIAITRQFNTGYNDEKAHVMSFSEKYTWLFRNEILGYLSDKLYYSDYNNEMFFVHDYGLLDNFNNPVQELSQKRVSNHLYIIPENTAEYSSINTDKEAVDKWINEEFVPNFALWLHPQNELIEKPVTLYSFNTMTNLIGNTHIWITSGSVKRKDFNLFINDIKASKENVIRNIVDLEAFHANAESRTYISPKEICSMNWKKEFDSNIKEITINDNMFIPYTINKSIVRCINNYDDMGEIYYKLPSKTLREILNICAGDGYYYYDENDNIKAVQLKEEDNTYLFADNKLIQGNKKYKFFWLFRVLKEVNIKIFSKYTGEFSPQVNRYWLVWYEKGKLEFYKYNYV